jgi:nucleotide-binding universal stress UspA family protein
VRGFGNVRGPCEVKVVTDKDRARMTIAEASRGYDLAVLADPQRNAGTSTMFGITIDEFLRHAPCATLLLRTPRPQADAANRPFVPWAPRVILVPTVGTERCRHAVEVAAVLAASTEAVVIVLHVVRPSDAAGREEVGQEIVERHGEWARQFGAQTRTMLVEGGARPDEHILAVVRDLAVDLVVLGSGLRVASTRAFFGHRIERLLERAPCPVAIVTA